MNANGITTEITRTYPHDVDVETIRSIEVDGETYVAFVSTRISPELAERRRGLDNWLEEDCVPKRVVLYRRWDCPSIAALGCCF